MGYLQNSVCYATYNEAMSAKFSASPVWSYDLTNSLFHTDVVTYTTAGSWVIQHWTSPLTAASLLNITKTKVIPTLDFPPCTPNSPDAMFADGLSMGWGVVAAMFAGLAVIFIARSFYR